MSNFDALVTKLREIFQIDRPELDFGVYRILNARAGEINAYLTTRLKEQVAEAFTAGAAANTDALAKELTDKIAQYEADGVNPDTVPAVQKLREAIAAATTGASEHENQVFSHLLTFFSRYYDKGDFISQRRYKGDTYAIPYSGEEVVLHWANKDQYYTKSGEAFSNYGFKLEDGRSVQFRLVAADTAKDNRKDNDKERRFVLTEARTVTRIDEDGEEYDETIVPVSEEDGALVIRFDYKAMPKGTKQDALVSQAVAAVLADETVKARWLGLTERAPTESNPQRTILEKCLTNYTQKNTADYFIHKNLGGFLRQELDFYIKNEVMNLDDVQNAAAFGAIEKNLRMIQCLRTIALHLIAFLAQIEDFQKKLWLKKKFVVSAHYCVTLDRVPEELYRAIAANPAQWAQWHDLGMRDSAAVGSVADLKVEPYLMVDTALFEADFKADLLKALPDLDSNVDGELFISENFQAGQLLINRDKGQVDLVYLDPPYNTDATPILYKNGYKDSSWATLMLDRIKLSNSFAGKNGVVSFAIDDTEVALLKMLIASTDASRDIFQCIVEHYPGSGTGRSNVSRTHEYCLFSVPEDVDVLRGDAVEDGERIRGFRRAGTGDNNFRIGNPGRPESFFAVLVNPDTFEVVGVEAPPAIGSSYPLDNTSDGLKRVYPIGEDGSERVWTLSYEGAKAAVADGRIISSDRFVIKRIYHDSERRLLLTSLWQGSQYNATTGGTNLLSAMFGKPGLFSYPKSLGTMERVLDAVLYAKPKAKIMDLFGGSATTAHAAIQRQRKSGSKCHYTLVEMGAHGEEITKSRIQKAVYSDAWAAGKPTKRENGITHVVKVLKIESYEDTLNNLNLRRDGPQGALLDAMNQQAHDEYLMRYMLDVEARGSLISVEDFRKPFDYALNITVDSAGAYERRKVDLVETFNYLIGLTVRHIDIQLKQGFVTVEGTLPTGEKTLILWRDCDVLDYEGLTRLCEKLAINPADSEYEVVYINGDHNIPSVLTTSEAEGEVTKVLKLRQIEPAFLSAMFDVADV